MRSPADDRQGRDGLPSIIITQIGLLSTYIRREGGSEDYQGENMLFGNERDEGREGSSGSMGRIQIT